MADGQDADVDLHQSSNVRRLVDRFMGMVKEVADDEDWAESDGWVGRMVLKEAKGQDQTYVYEIRDGEMKETQSSGPFVATITMGVETFLDLIDAALSNKAEEVFEMKYAGNRISYEGDRWIVDSERFRKVFRRLGAARARR